MKNKSSNWGLMLLIIFGIIILLLGFFYFFSKNASVKNYQDGFKEKADKLKQKIREMENNISLLINDIERFKAFDKFIVLEAVKILKAAKLMAILVVLSSCIFAYALFSYNLFTILTTAWTLLTILYFTVTVYFQNKVGDMNTTLQLIQIYIITRQYKKYNFQPTHIYILEEKLEMDRVKLEELQKNYIELRLENCQQNDIVSF